MKKTTKQWLNQLKDEHRDLAISNMFEGLEGEESESLADALYFGCFWSKSPQGEDFWGEIHDQLEAGTYFDAPQDTPEGFEAKAQEVLHLPTDPDERKNIPIYSGCVNYFPLALAAVARLSKKGNDQHNPDSPLHWDRSKSGDELDAMLRHVIDGDWDAVAWRALANLQKHEEEGISNEK